VIPISNHGSIQSSIVRRPRPRIPHLFGRFSQNPTINLTFQTLLGLIGHFLFRYDEDGEGPHGRMIFAECVAAVSTLLSLVWLVPFTWTFMHYPLDFLMAAAWFGSFAAWYTWISQNGLTCAGVFGIWNFDGDLHNYYCDEWRVVEGLAFLSGLLWLLSACLV
jgi:hypothetical protein